MKRLFTLSFALILMLAIAACTSGGDGKATEDAKKKILYVSQDTETDTIIVKRLLDMGYEVDKISDGLVKPESANGYDLIYMANSSRQGEVGGVFKQSTVPQFIQKPAYAYVVGTVEKQSATGSLEYQTKIKIKDAAHPIASGLSGTIDVYQVGGYIGTANPGAEATIIATAADDETRATIWAYEKGKKDASPFGTLVPARQVFFFLMSGEEVNQTDNSWKLFEASVKYAIEGSAQQ